MSDVKVIRRIRWDRIGYTIGGGTMFLAEAVSGNYPALLWCAVANGLAVLLFREQDKCLNAMETAVKMAMVIEAITNDKGEKNGNATAQS